MEETEGETGRGDQREGGASTQQEPERPSKLICLRGVRAVTQPPAGCDFRFGLNARPSSSTSRERI